MLTQRIMHECVKKLLGNVDNLEEEKIANPSQLWATVWILRRLGRIWMSTSLR